MSAVDVDPSTAEALPEYNWDALGSSPVKPSKVSRADFGRLLQEEANFERGNAVRAEKHLQQMRHQAQKDAWAERGRMLKEQRQRGSATIASKMEEVKQHAKEVGDDVRTQRELFRAKRQHASKTWQHHGHGLSQRQADLKEKLRAEKKANLEASQSNCTELKAELKALAAGTDDSVYRYKCDLAGRVKNATSQRVTRGAKLSFINERWDNADMLREQLMALRAQRLRQEHEYLAYALMTKEDIRKSNRDADEKQKAEMRQRAADIRREEKEMEDAVKAAKQSVADAKKAMHEQTETNKLVPDYELTDDGENLRGSLSGAFSRFFGFRQRGGGSSVSL